jgi:membrane protein
MRAPNTTGVSNHGAEALWVAALATLLLFAGFKPRRFSGAAHPREGAGRRRAPQNGQESGRGQSAEKPSDIPAPGWKDIVWRVYQNIGRDRVVTLAAGVTFYSILALFPAIAALVALYGLFADPNTISTHLDSLSGIVPEGAMNVLSDEIKRIAAQGNNTLGLTFVVGLATALWSANAGIKSLLDALNLVYKEPEKRGFIKLNALSLTFTLGAVVFVLLALGAMVVLPIILNYCCRCRAGCKDPSMARPPPYGRFRACRALSLRSEPRQAEVGVGHMGERVRRDCMGRGLHTVFLVCGELRQLQ